MQCYSGAAGQMSGKPTTALSMEQQHQQQGTAAKWTLYLGQVIYWTEQEEVCRCCKHCEDTIPLTSSLCISTVGKQTFYQAVFYRQFNS